MLRPLSAWELGRHLGAPPPIRSVKSTGLLHLTVRPLTGPLASVPASIPPGKHEEQLETGCANTMFKNAIKVGYIVLVSYNYLNFRILLFIQ